MFTAISHYHQSCFDKFPTFLDNVVKKELKAENDFFSFEKIDYNNIQNFVSTGTSSDSFKTTQDGDPATLVFNNFVVNAGHTVTTSNRCKGLYLYILGDLIVNGTLSMTARGAFAPGKYVLINKLNGHIHYIDNIEKFNKSYYYKYLKENYTVISKTGGLGTVYSKQSYANPGVNGACGAGRTLWGSQRWFRNEFFWWRRSWWR